MLPSRINMDDIRGKPRRRSPAHRAWVSSHRCCVPGCQLMPIECAHVNSAATRGMGMKSSDALTISLCREHHAETHRIGDTSFQTKHRIDMRALAAEFFKRSPHRNKLDDPNG